MTARRLKSALILAEFEDGRVEVVELPEGAQITMEARHEEPYYWDWRPGPYRYVRPTYTFTVKPGLSDRLAKWTRFERKPGRRLAWAVRRMVSAPTDPSES